MIGKVILSSLTLGAALSAALAAQAQQAPFDCPDGDQSYGVSNLGGYYYNALPGDFIVIESRTAHPVGDWLMLEHCPSRRWFSVLGEPDLPAEATNLFWRIVNSDESFTFSQMSDLIVRQGASTGTGQGVMDSCACRLQADPVTRKAAG
jgi:hypothetical protein